MAVVSHLTQEDNMKVKVVARRIEMREAELTLELSPGQKLHQELKNKESTK